MLGTLWRIKQIRGSGLVISLPLLGVLLVADTALIALHASSVTYLEPPVQEPENRNSLITTERGYAELFQHLKEFSIMLMLSLLALRRRSFLFLGWSAVFLYILLDDSLMIHEIWGFKLARALGFPSVLGLRPADLGELLVPALFGLLLAAILLCAYRVDRDPLARRMSVYLLAMLIVYAVTSGLDIAQVAIPTGPLMNLVFEIAEDGGELVVMSVTTWVVLRYGWADGGTLKNQGEYQC